MSEWRFCTKCGKPISQGDIFCGSCGAAQENMELSRIRSISTESGPLRQTLVKRPNSKKPRRSLFGIALLLGIFLLIAYAIDSIPPSPPPFYQSGPPADLITMLSYGDTSTEPFEGLDAGALAAQHLCKVIITDYTQKTYMFLPFTSTYKYGSTVDNEDEQSLVESEARLLVTQLTGQFIDKKSNEPISDKTAEALLHDEAKIYGRDQQDPVYACSKIMPGLAQFASQ